MSNAHELFVNMLIAMNAIARESVIYQGETLIINESLGLEHSVVREIPDNTVIKGDLDLYSTKQLNRIGNNVCVEGDINLSYSSINEIGQNLIVNGNVVIDSCKGLKNLPEDVSVEGELEIRYMKGLTLPKKINGVFELTIRSCEFALPDSFAVGGNLNIYSWDNIEKISNICADKNLFIEFCDNLDKISYVSAGQDLSIKFCNKLKEISNINAGQDISIDYCDSLELCTDISAEICIYVNGIEIKDIQEIKSVKRKSDNEPAKEIIEVDVDCNEQLSAFLLENELAKPEHIHTDGEVLIIDADLNLKNYKFNSFNVNLIVNGNMSLKYAKEIHGKLCINGDLKMSYLESKVYDAIVEVSGNMDMDYSKVQKAPEKLAVGGDLGMRGIKNYKKLPKEIDVKGNLDLESKRLTLPKKITVGKDASITTYNLRGLEEISVQVNLEFHDLEEEDVSCYIFAGGNLDLACSEIKKITGDVTVGRNLNLVSTYDLEEVSDTVKVGRRLILNESKYRSIRMETFLKDGCIHDNTVIDGDIELEGTKVSKIGRNVSVLGNAEISKGCINEIGDNFIVYGDLKVEDTHIKSIGSNMTVYGNAYFNKSNVENTDCISVNGKMLLEKTKFQLSKDTKIEQYIYTVDSQIENNADNCIIYNYDSFIKQYQEFGGAEYYFIKQEVEEYFKLAYEIKKLKDRINKTDLISKISEFEKPLYLGEFGLTLCAACEKINENDELLESTYDDIVFCLEEEGIVKCFIRRLRDNFSVGEFAIEGYKEIKKEIEMITDLEEKKDLTLLFELVIYKTLIRGFALLQMNKNINSIRRWGDQITKYLFFNRFIYEVDEDEELLDYSLFIYLKLPEREFRFVVGDYSKW